MQPAPACPPCTAFQRSELIHLPSLFRTNWAQGYQDSSDHYNSCTLRWEADQGEVVSQQAPGSTSSTLLTLGSRSASESLCGGQQVLGGRLSRISWRPLCSHR